MNGHCPDFNFDFNLGPDLENFIRNAKEAVRQFGERLRENAEREAPNFGFDPFQRPGPRAHEGFSPRFNAFPPTNVYKNQEGDLVLEFAIAGVEESTVKIGFQGDYLVLSARVPAANPDENRYERRSYRPRDIERQKYWVPAEDYEQAKAKAVLKSGLLTVSIPAKAIPESDAIRVTIVKEGT